jgi:hypothetical protein
MAGGLAFVPAQRSDAQVSVGIGGVGIGFGYPGYRYGYYNSYPYGYSYYPYGYYRPYRYYGYSTGPVVLPVRASGLPSPSASLLLSLLT